MIKTICLFVVMFCCSVSTAQVSEVVPYYQPFQPVVVNYPVVVYYPVTVQPVVNVQYVPVTQHVVVQNNPVLLYGGNWPIVNARGPFYNFDNRCWNRGIRYSYGY